MRTLMRMKQQLAGGKARPAMGWLLALGVTVGWSTTASAECPWIVQPHVDRGSESKQTFVNIIFDGLDDQRRHFYGFTITDADFAWSLTTYGTLSDLRPNSRPLLMVETARGPAFELSAESLKPHAVYLVAANAPVSELEQLNAAIEPSEPFHMSYITTRGATDISGPLPSRSLPGVEIRASQEKNDVNRWLTLLEKELEDEDQGAGDEHGTETVLALEEIEATNGARGKDGMRRDVQICAYQVATR